MTKARKLKPRNKRAKKPDPIGPGTEGVLSALETVLEVFEGYSLYPEIAKGAELIHGVMNRLGPTNEFEFTVKRKRIIETSQYATIRVRGATRRLAQGALQNLFDRRPCGLDDLGWRNIKDLEWKTDPGLSERHSDYRIECSEQN